MSNLKATSKMINFFMYVFAILLIMNFTTVFIGYSPLLGKLSQGLLIVIVLICGFFSFASILMKSDSVTTRFIWFLLSIFILFIVLLVSNVFRSKFPVNFYLIYLILPIFTVAFLIKLDDYGLINELLYKFENIIVVLAVLSIFGWIWFSLHLPPNSYATYNWGNMVTVPGFFHVDFITQGNVKFLLWNNVVRNSGIFAEAPMYAYYLSIALLIEMFIREKDDKSTFKLLVLSFAIITTTSSSGLIILVLSIVCKIFFKVNNIGYKILCFMASPGLILIIENIINTKKSAPYDIYTSYAIRNNDIYATFTAWKHNIIFGNGISNDASYLKYEFAYRIMNNGGGNTNGLLIILALGGIIYGLYYFLPVILSARVSKNVFVFSIMNLIFLYFEPLQKMYLCIFIFCYICALFIIKKKKYLYD